MCRICFVLPLMFQIMRQHLQKVIYRLNTVFRWHFPVCALFGQLALVMILPCPNLSVAISTSVSWICIKGLNQFFECNVWVDYSSCLCPPWLSWIYKLCLMRVNSHQVEISFTPHDLTGLVPVSLGKGMVSFRDSDPVWSCWVEYNTSFGHPRSQGLANCIGVADTGTAGRIPTSFKNNCFLSQQTWMETVSRSLYKYPVVSGLQMLRSPAWQPSRL